MNNLKKLRTDNGMSLQALADAVKVSKPHIWDMEKGKSENPGIKLAYSLAKVFGVTVYDIWPDETEIEVETVEIRRVKPKHIKANIKESEL